MSGEMSAAPLSGGCLCGRVRYRIARAGDASWCHCTMCRRSSGAPAVPWVSVLREDFELTGPLLSYASSPGATRSCCAQCGGVLLFELAHEDAVDVAVGTLDDPQDCAPTHHIWVSSALPMADGLGPDLPRHAREREKER